MPSISIADFRTAFFNRHSPRYAQQLVEVIDFAGRRSTEVCEAEFPAGNNAMAQGWMRRQFIEDRCRSAHLDGGVIAEARDYKGHVLDGDERCHNFTLLQSKDVASIIFRASTQRPIPQGVPPIREYLATLPFSTPPLFPDHILRNDLLPNDLKAFFFVRYWLDSDDPTGSTVGDIDVIVLDHTCKNIFCHVCDLREYAATAVIDAARYEYDRELPISFREVDESDGQTPDILGDIVSENNLPTDDSQDMTDENE